jgi:hypothetical protein
MVPPDTAPKLVQMIRATIPVVAGTSNLEAPLAMDFSMAYGPPASHNENYAHSWLQDTVEDFFFKQTLGQYRLLCCV